MPGTIQKFKWTGLVFNKNTFKISKKRNFSAVPPYVGTHICGKRNYSGISTVIDCFGSGAVLLFTVQVMTG